MKPIRNDSTIVGLRTVGSKASLVARGRCRFATSFAAGVIFAALYGDRDAAGAFTGPPASRHDRYVPVFDLEHRIILGQVLIRCIMGDCENCRVLQ